MTSAWPGLAARRARGPATVAAIAVALVLDVAQAFRLLDSLIARLDRHVERMSKEHPGLAFTRADAVKDQSQDLLARAKNPEPLRPSKRAPRVPAGLDEIYLKALAVSKDDRYADCGAMRRALQSWLTQHAPATDATRISRFLFELFAEDIQRERVERTELLARVRTRALTLPVGHELRTLAENSSTR